jgi:hypothetical protein
LNHNFFHKEFDGTDSVLVPDTATVVVVDADGNGRFNLKAEDPTSDYLIIGDLTASFRTAWGSSRDLDRMGYAYTIQFPGRLPRLGSILHLSTRRPFTVTDAFKFSITESHIFNKSYAKEQMENIKVVPNPYIATNVMEPRVRQGLNQRRVLMFTHIPAKCKITIYSVSGYLVDTIEVNNEADDGHVFWDMRTMEGLEIAFGLYIYRVEAPDIGEKFGKFAVIK